MQTPPKAIARRLTRTVAAVTMALVATTLPVAPGLPAGVRVAVAADPAPSPSPAPATSPDVTPDPNPDASASPTPDVTPAPTDTPAPTADPTATPAPTDTPSDTPAPDPSASSTPDPGAAPSPDPTPTPDPTATPIPYKLSGGQQQGDKTDPPVPVYKLISPMVTKPYTGPSPHQGYTFDGPDCALCHRAHTGGAPAILAGSTQAAVCFECHSPGGGATADVQTQFDVPPNDDATDAYYSHPVTDPSASLHVLQGDDTFANTLNRHAVCADCHNPHNATDDRPAQTTTGWTAPGSIKGVSAVAVTNGAGGSAPTYQLLPAGQATYEYQLCIQCHLGSTALPDRSAANPSRWALDKGIEFNPANNSTHLIEARGKNLTAQMQASLSGTSPFKAWNYSIDSTNGCASCHGDPSTVNQTASGTPKTPDPAAESATHASPNRGLLIAPYRDRDLKPAGEAYNSADFALCYLCHAERPFVDPNASASSPDTNFPYHGAHMTLLGSNPGGGTDIDTAGAGEGQAVCAECHFRIHSTAIAYKLGDTVPTARATGSQSLVDFAPNVRGVLTAAPTWTQPGATGQGSCTLTCHGYQHTASNTRYTIAPAAGFSANITTGSKGLTGLPVVFTDASRYLTPATGTWSWTFGDGGTSTLQNPSHTYTATGTFTVTLTVTRTSGGLSSTLTRTGYITVTP
ncbi:MAG: cytochrome c3 family protein [Chloroflexota bacterium]